MLSYLKNATLNVTIQLISMVQTVTMPSARSLTIQQSTAGQNGSLDNGCLTLVFSDMEYVPWDNPDNIVSAAVHDMFSRIKGFALVFLFVIGGPGNIINMAVFYKQGLKDRVNVSLFALSLADELYLIVAMCCFSEQVHLQVTTAERYGPMLTFLSNNYLIGLLGFLYVSTTITAIIASERCYCVLRPLKFQTLMRTRTMVIIISVVYVLIIGLYSIVAFRFHVGCVNDPITGATFKANTIGKMYENHKELVDAVDGFVFGAGIPGVVMIVVITATLITIVKLRQIATWRAEASSTISPREVALTKMLVGTSILFIICVFPFAMARISWLVFPEVNPGRRNHNFFLVSLYINEILSYVNTSFNIFVYYGMGSRYRETFWELFSRRTRSQANKM